MFRWTINGLLVTLIEIVELETPLLSAKKLVILLQQRPWQLKEYYIGKKEKVSKSEFNPMARLGFSNYGRCYFREKLANNSLWKSVKVGFIYIIPHIDIVIYIRESICIGIAYFRLPNSKVGGWGTMEKIDDWFGWSFGNLGELSVAAK